MLLAVAFLLSPQIGSVTPRNAVGHQPPAPSWVVNRYQVDAADWNPRLRVTLTGLQGQDADLYVAQGRPPTLVDWDFRSAKPNSANELILVDGTTTPPLATDTWHIGIWHDPATTYNISYWFEASPGVHPGAGAIPFDDRPSGPRGVSFRVWAPNASGVSLAGDFNNWNGSSAPMAAESSGWWSLDVRNLLAGAAYQFVINSAGQLLWKNDPRALQVTSSMGNSIVVDHAAFNWSGSQWSMPSWDDLVLYEMHIGTFNDIVGGSPGTLNAAKFLLNYLRDLGVTAIELMPFCEFPGEFSWGYNDSYPFAVESAYGPPSDLKAFVDAAHARGMAVFGDVLYNHWGPIEMDLWQFDGWSPGPNWGGIYFYNDWRCVTPWGNTRPDMTVGEVRQYIHDNVLMWLQDYRLDGLRWDSTSYLRNVNGVDLPEAWSLMQWINDDIDATQPWKLNVAEDMWSNDSISKSTGAGGAGFDSQWDPNFVHPVRRNLIAPNDSSRDMNAIRDSIGYSYNGNWLERVIYTESHDEVANGNSRLPEDIWPGNASSWFSKKRSTLGAVLVMTSPGIPMLFQGQEILEDGFFDDTDPIDWSKLSTFSGIHLLYQDLIRLRRDLDGNSAGLKGSGLNIHHVNNSGKVIAFHRYRSGGPGDDVLVVLNFANQTWTNYTIGAPRSGTWNARFNSDSTAYDPSYGNFGDISVSASNSSYDGMPASITLRLAPYTAVILSQ